MPKGSKGIPNPRKGHKQAPDHPWHYQKTGSLFYSKKNKHKFDENIDMNKHK